MKKSNLVYSTDSSQLCSACQEYKPNCQCDQKEQVLGDGKVRLLLETKGRKGKGVTVITGLAMTEAELKQFAKQLKAACGTGGAVKAGNIEIQGDNRDKLLDLLSKKGIHAKKAGGA
ncbi:translation initiation factor [Marinomonas agarivorans]|nr:translation initiation factor [Marinomonas agarivorans]